MREESQNKIRELEAIVGAGVDRYNERGDLERGFIDSTVVPKLKEVAGDICRDIEKSHTIGEIEDQDKSIVIHYTSISVLFSMLQDAANGQKASLRLYDSVHFNDPKEGYHLVNALSGHHDWVEKGLGHSSHAYIASFIRSSTTEGEEERDNLVFWRTYGQEGEGCSLKLKVENSRLQNVSYGTEDLMVAVEVLLPVLSALEPLVDASQDEDYKETIKTILAVAFCESLEGIQFLYKDEAYSYENECRVIMRKSSVSESSICYELKSDSPVTIRHYCEHDALSVWEIFGSDSTITIGPCVRNYHELEGVLRIMTRRINQRMKQRMKLLGPNIQPSRIEYQRF